jgi:uncharacterized tellurite resistance protein B-like protein
MCVRQALADFTITEKERKALRILEERLAIPADVAAEVEEKVKQEKYESELDARLSDAVLTKKEASELWKIRNLLGLSSSGVREATKDGALKGYRMLFKRFAADGLVSVEDLQELQELAEATGMTPAEAANISVNEALHLFNRTVTMVCQDGIVTDEEQKLIDGLEELLRLPKALVRPLKQRGREVAKLGRIRRGELPRVSSGEFQLKSTELCHWYSGCHYSYQTRTRLVELSGKLIVTNRRVIFNAPERAFEFSIKRILNVRQAQNVVQLELTSTRGQGVLLYEGSRRACGYS